MLRRPLDTVCPPPSSASTRQIQAANFSLPPALALALALAHQTDARHVRAQRHYEPSLPDFWPTRNTTSNC
ncbi:hypothetical protein KJE20_08213 [Pyrenophora tritici-repentis]|uniref:Uncharacterized protein n=1 Tax=Pyrenophora tritici-repentis TaxID=45151 RepID=A0A922N3R1_9PLEO|nr:hypothetical protein Ptr86124_010529 [Pyrenophora tritici-repentis]KAI1681342.1 hypothetical protein KJE20_08213 [Pyrenophora tritici-repentis]